MLPPNHKSQELREVPHHNDEPQGCLIAILRLFGIRLDGPTERNGLPYRLRSDFLSRAEYSFYRVLVTAIGNRAVVCPKVNISDIFFVVNARENQAYRNKIDRKHVDFLICDPDTMQPRMGVELDDSTHERRDRQERDEFVDQVFEVAGLPLLRIPAKAEYDPKTIWDRVAQYLKAESALSAEPLPSAAAVGPPRCPTCGVPLVLRTASRGKQAGQQFYGCPNFPRCRETSRA